MEKQEIHQFLKRYFIANQCLIEEQTEGHLTIQLTVDMDKELMNRPFYWHYLEKTGGTPNPMKLTLITDQTQAPEDIKGEMIHYGSPRLHQIFHSAKKLSRFTRLYQQHELAPGGQNTPLYPWLGMNIKVSYRADRKRDVFKSLGLNLIHGQLVEEFHSHLTNLSLTAKIPDYSFTMTPMIKPKSGVLRMKRHLTAELSLEQHQWAEEARKRWKEDLTLLDHFYEDQEEKPESYYIEKEALKDQYEPKIKMEIINGGIFYLLSSRL
ncbi:MAG TPA: YqhG family protein [Chondromyces sp.]|nr:YqhG family protein [Chondromyces sp.]